MKKIFWLFCISFLLFVKSNYPQPDSVLSYMPLVIGNQWQYRVHYVVNNSNIDTTYYKLFTVEHDTTMPNGYQYQVLESDTETKYVHIDSATACVYEYEYNSSRGIKTDSLRCSEGDFFGINNYCELIDTASILNYKTWVMVIDRTMPDISEKHALAMDIGISYKEVVTTYGFGTIKTSTLVYANINGTEFGEMVTSFNDLNNTIKDSRLNQNYPNPFNPSTTIKFQIPEAGFTSLKVYDVLGKEVATLINDELQGGSYKFEFDRSKLTSGVSARGGYTSGVYFYQLITENYIETRKMVLIK